MMAAPPGRATERHQLKTISKTPEKRVETPRQNLDQLANEIIGSVQKRKHTRYLNLWERVSLYNQKFRNYPRMDWDKGFIKGNWLLGNWYGRDSDFFGAYPASCFTRIHELFKQDSDVFLHLFAGTMRPQPPNVITFDINPEIKISRTVRQKVKGKTVVRKRPEIIKPTIVDDVRNLGYNVKITRNQNNPPKIGDHDSYILRKGSIKVKVMGRTRYKYWWIIRKYSRAYRKIFSIVDVVYADPPYPGNFHKFNVLPFRQQQVLRDLGVLMPKGSFLCWLDTLYPMFRKDQWKIIGTIEVRIGTNTQVRGWTLWQRK
ncbi:MAG: hypothetical protein OK439_00210 [Thaumarchaeota archaeon]|nr:hypothetical protein [Nitrososphaerota archaeon]